MPKRHICDICLGWLLLVEPYHLELKKCVSCGQMKDFKMISLKEILKGTDYNKLDTEIQNNLMDLLEALNKFRAEYKRAMNVTSGLRTKQDQIRIYNAKGITDESKIPMNSPHISGEAADFADKDGKLKAFAIECDKNGKLKQWGLWMEDPSVTISWIHLDIRNRGDRKSNIFKV